MTLAWLIPAAALACLQLATTRHEPAVSPEPVRVRTESAAEAEERHARVVERRKGVDVICHRGAWEFAHENTLEAYRATLELGGDGNEIDIRATKDGVLVCFHDDMLDRLLEAYGAVNEFTWDELRTFRFRDPGPFAADCRIPTLVEVFDLHRRHAGLLHLDIKEPGLDRVIVDLLDRMDMWDHVGHCNAENAAAIMQHPKLRLRRYKAGLFADRQDVDPAAIAAALQKPGDSIIVDDPRGVLMALGRKPGRVSTKPVAALRSRPEPPKAPLRAENHLLAVLRRAEDWNLVADSPDEQLASGRRIRARARAAEQFLAIASTSQEAFDALEKRVRNRSLHKHWMYHGFDGAMALRTLILLKAPNAVETARFALWRDDAGLEPVVNRKFDNPRAWTDFRVKMVIFPALEKLPGPATEKLCRDYLALADEEARPICPPQFEAAAKTLLTVSPGTDTALELMKHRLNVVRGRAILECWKHAGQPWARAALEKGAPWALKCLVD